MPLPVVIPKLLVRMEKLRRLVNEIAYTHDFSELSPAKRSIIPLLSCVSSIYGLSLSIRHYLWMFGLFRKQRLPVPVISVGNLTWGGNGKTPMVECLSLWFAHSGIPPLILSRGYSGGDEVKMLHRHLLGTSAKIGIGASRAKTALSLLGRYGHVDPRTDDSLGNHFYSGKIGVVILDDGLQMLSLKTVALVINKFYTWKAALKLNP
ncbi:hypothetical protein Nepgr_026832 [Nepenthes gracilis]|uniref:tetraacyldisaccharide 4'-kinase n=1 Tax=Nepenthes gracilis TaxID=150966 RepID=A0AAD3Y2H3_NEPGR|nr:hypothetical protein Nepgr_026832 [Nepenthes gracilis]